MTKLQFLLVSSLITSVVFLLMGSRDGNSIDSVIPIAAIVALTTIANRYISEHVWDKAAIWVNQTTGRRIFKTKLKRLPPSKSRKLR
jgi:hypothetical protein